MQHTPLSYNEWKQLTKPELKGEVDLLLDGLQSIENAGLILRSSEGLGVRRVLFYQPEFEWKDPHIKVFSSSAVKRVDTGILHSEKELRGKITSDAYRRVTALEYTNRSKSLFEAAIEFPLLLIAGNEQRGIRSEILEWVQEAVHIPLSGQQSSINVACAVTAVICCVNQGRIPD